MTATDVFSGLAELYPELTAYRFEAADLFYPEYQGRPLEFVREVLKRTLTPQQEQILLGLETAPYRVLAKAGHTVGKTMVAACAVLYWHLTRKPCVIITTAPKFEQVRDLLWKEIRKLAPRGVKLQPKGCRIERSSNDFATGTTARAGVSFAGQHEESMLFIFDEAVGIDSEFWEVAETMFQGHGHAWLCLFNPTDTSSTAYIHEHNHHEEGRGWTVVTLSALEHPNILAELAGEPPPVRGAVRLARATEMLEDWSDPIRPEDALATDLEWPPRSGRFLRPGPIAECRLLGRWPSQSFYSVWGDRLWQSACDARLEWNALEWPILGCDVARFGDDNTAIHGRRGPASYHHEEHNGWDGVQIAARLKELAREAAKWVCGDEWDRSPVEWQETQVKRVKIIVDDTGGIGGVYEQLSRDGYNVVPVNAACTAQHDLEYHDVRSELWFLTRDLAQKGKLDLSRLPERVRSELRIQAMAQMWKVDGPGRRQVLPKEVTKEELGRSPDGMDAMNLCYYSTGSGLPGEVHKPDPRPSIMDRDRERTRSKLFRR